MKLLLLFLSLFTFIFSKDKEVENEMAIPSGYRAINSGDVGKQFGTHLDGTIYFDISKDGNATTFERVLLSSNSAVGGNYELVGHEDTLGLCNYYSLVLDSDYPTALNLYEYEIATEIGTWLSYESYNLSGYTILGVYDRDQSVIYVKPINSTYSVTFVENGGSDVDDVDGVTALPNPLPVPTKNGYTFAGWWNSDYSVHYTDGYTIYYNYTLYANWTANLYNITYKANGGSAVPSNIGVTSFPSPLPTTTKAGSTFGGWWNSNFSAQYTAGQTIYGSLIAYAKWIVNSYTVTWVENGGTPAPDDLTDVASLPSPLPIITKTGYELDGWYFNSLFTSQALAGDQLVDNVILYAKFVRVLYVIGYELDGGTNNLGNPDEYNAESPTITLLDPSKVGYTFNGWFSDAEKTTAITSIPTGTTGDITIYASFTLSETGYSITWVENGGTPEQTDLTNQNYLPSVLPALYKANYIFKGWYKDEVLTIAAAPSAIIGENTTLYAKFEAHSTQKKGYIRVEPIDTTLNATSKKPLQNKAIYSELSYKVDKVAGKGLSTNDYTTTEKNKLAGIASGAEINVQSDWTQATNTADDYIKNKPAIPTKVSDLTNDTGYITGYTETDPIFTAWNKSTGISITKSQVSDLIEATQSLSGLMSATDKQRLDVLHALLEEDTANNVVDSINEVLAIFENYPEGANLVTILQGKVDKTSIIDNLTTDDATKVLSANQGKVLKDLIDTTVGNIEDILDSILGV